MAVNSFNAQNPPVTTKGDVFTFSTVPTRLGVGANNTVLTADSSTATGLKWASPAAGANWTAVNAGGTALTGAATITVSGISGADKILVVIDSASSASASSQISIRVNTLSTSIYNFTGPQLNPNTTYASTDFAALSNIGNDRIILGSMSASAASLLHGGITFTGCNTSGVKQFISIGGAGGASGGQYHRYVQGWVDTSAAITSVSAISGTGNFDNGTIYVFQSA